MTDPDAQKINFVDGRRVIKEFSLRAGQKKEKDQQKSFLFSLSQISYGSKGEKTFTIVIKSFLTFSPRVSCSDRKDQFDSELGLSIGWKKKCVHVFGRVENTSTQTTSYLEQTAMERGSKENNLVTLLTDDDWWGGMKEDKTETADEACFPTILANGQFSLPGHEFALGLIALARRE